MTGIIRIKIKNPKKNERYLYSFKGKEYTCNELFELKECIIPKCVLVSRLLNQFKNYGRNYDTMEELITHQPQKKMNSDYNKLENFNEMLKLFKIGSLWKEARVLQSIGYSK